MYLAPTYVNVNVSKGYYHYYYYNTWAVLTVFTAGNVLGCLSDILCGIVTLAKADTGPVRREKCGFLW